MVKHRNSWPGADEGSVAQMEEIDLSVATPGDSQVQAAALGPPARETKKLGRNWSYVAASPAMLEIRKQVNLVANIDVPLLLLGESGTGKEVIARLIHKESSRAQRTFMKVNCAALPVELLESELFGYEAGAFTGANQAKPGKFEICHRGTILLDEIAEMPIPPQAKLLHVLQDGEFSRLGSSTVAKSDVRVLAATNVDIHQAIESRKFRADLYYRVSAFTIHLPALRERKEDISVLLNYFVTIWADLYSRPRLNVSAKMLDVCLRYPWPGNVRELESFAKRYLILGDEKKVLSTIDLKSMDIPNHPGKAGNAIPADCSDLKSLVRGVKREAETAAITRALDRAQGSRKDAAKMLKISLRALQYKIQRYGIDVYTDPSARLPE
jgi:two-component system response regulator AtoC